MIHVFEIINLLADTFLLVLAVIKLFRDILGPLSCTELIPSPVRLNRRDGPNEGRSRGLRRQPDPNPNQFRECFSVPMLRNQLSYLNLDPKMSG